MSAIKSNGRRKENKKVSTTPEESKPEPQPEPPANKKYLLRTPQFEIAECCGGNPDGIYFNVQNKVVQCHHCGHVYRPMLYRLR